MAKEAQVKPCVMEHVQRYGEIYAAAFSCEPWNDDWSVEDATVHVREILESKQSYGLEYLIDGQLIGFILGSSMLFHYGRVFEINDLAVLPEYQHQGIGSVLLERMLSDIKAKGMRSINLITASKGALPAFYEKHGFKRETFVTLMSSQL